MERISMEEFERILMERAKENEKRECLNALYKITHPGRDVPYEPGEHAYGKEVM